MTDVADVLATSRVTAGPAVASDLARHGSAVALWTDDGEITYASLARRVQDWADRLTGPRSLVAIEVVPTVESIAAYLGAMTAGHAVMVLGPNNDLEMLHRAFGPTHVLRPDGHTVAVEHVVSGARPDLHPDLCLLLGTSGSTGSPRWVRLSTRNVDANATAIAASLSLGADDCGITALPLSYCYGLSVLHSHLAVGGAVALTGNSVVDECFWATARQAGVTSLATVPHTLDLLDRSGAVDRFPASLRLITQAGGALRRDSVLGWAETGARSGWEFVVMYGQTEATARMCVLPSPLAATRPESVGRPIEGGTITLDHDAAPAGTDPEVGEVVYRGPNVMMGYATTAACLRRGADLTELRTGDLGRIDENGLLTIVGRSARFAKLFGLRLDLDHLEDRLSDHGFDACCIEHDGRLGVVVAAEVQDDRLGLLVSELAGVTRSAIVIQTVDELPRRPNGKLDRAGSATLLDRLTPPTTGGSTPTPSQLTGESDREECIREVFRSVLGTSDRPSPTDSFVSLGGDSMSYVEASIRLEAVVGPLPDRWHLMTVEELARSQRPSGEALASAWVPVETGLLLRAVAIVAIVARHIDLSDVVGGGHVLLGICGYNFARFQLDGGARPRAMWRSIGRVAIPAALYLAVVSLVTGGYGLRSVALMNHLLGSDHWDDGWRYWFVEALVQILVVATLVFAIPRVRRFETRHRYATALTAVGVLALWRFDPFGLVADPLRPNHPLTVAWLFALGWLIHRSASRHARLLTTGIVVIATWGFFDIAWRNVVVIAGLLVLLWIPRLRLPRSLVPAIGATAGASLWIYLTHWQVYAPLDGVVSDWITLAACLVVGWCAHRAYERTTAGVAHRFRAIMRRHGDHSATRLPDGSIDAVSPSR